MNLGIFDKIFCLSLKDTCLLSMTPFASWSRTVKAPVNILAFNLSRNSATLLQSFSIFFFNLYADLSSLFSLKSQNEVDIVSV